MSRIGKMPIQIPDGVTVTFQDGVVSVKGPKGNLSQKIDPSINFTVENNIITVEENREIMTDNPIQRHAYHGLYRSLINNMVVGVSQGYTAEMEVVGVGYRVVNQGNIIMFDLLHSHSIALQLPPEIKVETKTERNKSPYIKLESCDKQLLGQVCAKIRSFRKPEPYKGKGIKFVGEVVRRKSGKSAAVK
ncbi:MAG TPA: 50S ribosomal protein L6 [Bacteroidaceae bacterium]|nr:50S ribosomal protein L6 [Bacteroidaceae bacterium]